MNSDFAPMIVSTVFILVSGAVLLLRPISKRLGAYLEVLAEDRRRAAASPLYDSERLAAVLETLDRRLARLEERQQFTEALLSRRQAPALSNHAEPVRIANESDREG